VKLSDAVPAEVVSSMRAGTWQALGARGIAARDPSTWARPDGLPERGSTWSVPGTAWHFDHLYRSPGVVTAVNLFLLIDDVAPTAARTAERTARYTTETLVDGIPMRVDELCGSAGDVFVCQPALLHTISMNVSSRPRLMRVQRIHTTNP
jgi:hypothetical protein